MSSSWAAAQLAQRRARVSRTLAEAREAFDAALLLPEWVDRYLGIHRAALSTAAAVIDALTERRRSRGAAPLSAWALLVKCAPELRDHAAWYAEQSKTRSAVEAGIHRFATPAAVEEATRRTERFMADARAAVERWTASAGAG